MWINLKTQPLLLCFKIFHAIIILFSFKMNYQYFFYSKAACTGKLRGFYVVLQLGTLWLDVSWENRPSTLKFKGGGQGSGDMHLCMSPCDLRPKFKFKHCEKNLKKSCMFTEHIKIIPKKFRSKFETYITKQKREICHK